MYETYWRLTQKPFENAADPRFYYPAESHQAALLKLRYTIENRRGAALLAGPSGMGQDAAYDHAPRHIRPEVHALRTPGLPANVLRRSVGLPRR